MDSAELSRWYVRWRRIAPFGDQWRQTGLLASVIANVNRGRDSEPFLIEDFMPLEKKTDNDKQSQSADEQRELAATIHAALLGI